MRPVIIDIEASGFGKGSYPVEVGVAMQDGSRHCFLVAPAREWTAWDLEAELVHGISRDILIKHGSPVEDVAERLNDILYNETAYSDAWSFDMSWLGKLYDAAEIPQRFKVGDLTDLMTEEQRRRWSGVKKTVESELGLQRHRASGDARVLQETWRRVCQRAA